MYCQQTRLRLVRVTVRFLPLENGVQHFSVELRGIAPNVALGVSVLRKAEKEVSQSVTVVMKSR